MGAFQLKDVGLKTCTSTQLYYYYDTIPTSGGHVYRPHVLWLPLHNGRLSPCLKKIFVGDSLQNRNFINKCTRPLFGGCHTSLKTPRFSFKETISTIPETTRALPYLPDFARTFPKPKTTVFGVFPYIFRSKESIATIPEMIRALPTLPEFSRFFPNSPEG
ncbi:hypothetical protein NQ317_009116 [Molorchus minor]|uniref:Uncharacterized protein n=1 Tax=Molorchus minor TaxID=1323400 RepID=A0ABQ9IZV3_9CUCU|nr:hypothetical protein NQ317_009116 [Molorchus minor]